MSSARARTSQPVSLFPFLAVLMCTMGALILLLIVTSRRIRRDAVARSQPAAIGGRSDSVTIPEVRPPTSDFRPPAVVPPVPELDSVVQAPSETDRIIAEHHASILHTNAKRKAEVARLQAELQAITRKRDALNRHLAAALQRHRTARTTLERLQSDQKQLAQTATASVEQVATLNAEVSATATAINGIRRKLAMLKLQQAQASSEFAIVPFDGATGTTRRPVFIECTEKCIRFLPEGVELTATDLIGFTADYNPLLAGAQRLVHYWAAKAGSKANEPEPYVLLLVRPGGSVAYYAARKMLRGLNQPVGYELIEADWDVHLPEVDPQAKAVCEQAVNRARGHRRRPTSSISPDPLTSPIAGGQGKVMRFNRATGRLEVVQNDSKPSLGPFGGLVDGGDSRTAGAKGGLQPRVHTRGSASAAATPDDRTNGNARSRDSKASRKGARGEGVHSGDSASRRNAGASDGDSTKGTAKLWPLNEETAGGKRGESDNQRDQRPGDPHGRSDSHTVGRTGDGRRSSRSAEPRSEPGDGVPQRGSSTSRDWKSAGTGGAGGSPSAGANSTPGMGLFGNSGGKPRRHSPRRRWGFSSPNATIGFEREIALVVTTDRLIVQDRQTIPVGKGETRDELVKQVVLAVERTVRSWGKPPDSFYWVPTLRFVISPGGNRHYERLAGAVKTYGLQSAAEYRLESPPSTGGR